MIRLAKIAFLSAILSLTMLGSALSQSERDSTRFEVRRLALVDMAYVLRNAEATTKIRELLDDKKQEFSNE